MRITLSVIFLLIISTLSISQEFKITKEYDEFNGRTTNTLEPVWSTDCALIIMKIDNPSDTSSFYTFGFLFHGYFWIDMRMSLEVLHDGNRMNLSCIISEPSFQASAGGWEITQERLATLAKATAIKVKVHGYRTNKIFEFAPVQLKALKYFVSYFK